MLRWRRTTARRSSSRAREPYVQPRAIWASFPEAWVRARSSCVAAAIRRASTVAVTGPVARCRAAKRSVAAAVGQAHVSGATIGSTQLTFVPAELKCGDYSFAIGSAGSATLVLQTILPALLTMPGRCTVTVEGGTHNPAAPPFDFFAKAFL